MRIDTLLERVVIAWALLGGLLLIAIVLVTTTNAGAFALDRVARQFGTTVAGLPGYEDFVRLTVSAAALMFFPMCQWKRGHVAVEVLTDMFSERMRRGLDFAWLVLTVAAALFLAYWMWEGMIETRQDRSLSRVLGWSEWPFYLPGVISLVLWALVALYQLVRGGKAAEDEAGLPNV